jgi:hypothetical protein
MRDKGTAFSEYLARLETKLEVQVAGKIFWDANYNDDDNELTIFDGTVLAYRTPRSALFQAVPKT